MNSIYYYKCAEYEAILEGEYCMRSDGIAYIKPLKGAYCMRRTGEVEFRTSNDIDHFVIRESALHRVTDGRFLRIYDNLKTI